MSTKKEKDREKSVAVPAAPAPIAEIPLPKGFLGLLKHLMYSLHVVRPVGALGVDKFCYEWFANRIADQRNHTDAKPTFNEDYLDDNIWKLEVAEPPLLSYGDDEDSDFDENDITDTDVFDLKELDPMHVVEDEAARKIQLSYRAFVKRRKLRTRRLDAERARQKVKKQHERAKNKNAGSKTDLHWTATETLIPGMENDMDLGGIAAENEQRTSEDRAERKRARASEQMQKNFDTRKMLDSVGADQEEADLAAAKIQAVYRKHQIEKTRAEISELQKVPSSVKVDGGETENRQSTGQEKPVKSKKKEQEENLRLSANAERKEEKQEEKDKTKKSKKAVEDESSSDQKDEKPKSKTSKKKEEESSADDVNSEKPKEEKTKKLKKAVVDEPSSDQKEEKTKSKKSKKKGEESSNDDANSEKPKKERRKKK